MGKSYSTDLRERVLQAIEEGMSKAQAHRTFPLGRSTIDRWFALREQTGGLNPPPHRSNRVRQLEGKEFEAFAHRHRHATLGEMARAWQQEKGVSLSTMSFSRALGEIGWTHKKRVGVTKSWCYKERDEAKRAGWIKALEAVAVCDRVYVDETGCDDRLQRECGWSVRGEPCLDRRAVP